MNRGQQQRRGGLTDKSTLRLLASGLGILFILHNTKNQDGVLQVGFWVGTALAIVLIVRALLSIFPQLTDRFIQVNEPQAAALSAASQQAPKGDLPANMALYFKPALRSVALQTKEHNTAVAVVDPLSSAILWSNRAWFRLFDVPSAVFWLPSALPEGPTRSLALIPNSTYPSMRRVFREVRPDADLSRIFAAASTPNTRKALGIEGDAHPLRVVVHKWQWEPDYPSLVESDGETSPLAGSKKAASSAAGDGDGDKSATRKRTLSAKARDRDSGAITTQMWAARLSVRPSLTASASEQPPAPWVVYLSPLEPRVSDLIKGGSSHFVLRAAWPGLVRRRNSDSVDLVSTAAVFQLLGARLLLLGLDQELSILRVALQSGAKVAVGGNGIAFDVVANTAALARAVGVVKHARKRVSGQEATIANLDGPIPRQTIVRSVRECVETKMKPVHYTSSVEAVEMFVEALREVLPTWLRIVRAEYPSVLSPEGAPDAAAVSIATPPTTSMVTTSVTYSVSAEVVPSVANDDAPAERPCWRPVKYDESAAVAAASLAAKAVSDVSCGGGFGVVSVRAVGHTEAQKSGKGAMAVPVAAATDDDDTLPDSIKKQVRRPRVVVEFAGPADRPPSSMPAAPSAGPSNLEAAAGAISAAIFSVASGRAPMGTLSETLQASLPAAVDAALRSGQEASMARIRSQDPAVPEDPSLASSAAVDLSMMAVEGVSVLYSAVPSRRSAASDAGATASSAPASIAPVSLPVSPPQASGLQLQPLSVEAIETPQGVVSPASTRPETTGSVPATEDPEQPLTAVSRTGKKATLRSRRREQ